MSEEVVLSYCCTRFCHPNDKYYVIWNDPEIKIKWPTNNTDSLILTPRVCNNHSFAELKKKFDII